ncbi:Uncharacterised protein [Vibrio cholerae]|nr:Uncharacterised protein [Vibrio cholerae]CSI07630.1 Uncharacterised protein [Vibrio cholerae]
MNQSIRRLKIPPCSTDSWLTNLASPTFSSSM